MNLAPNGKPSNLTPEQYRLVRTPAFKNWFGDWEEAITKDYEGVSKIIDENGEPSICYHVTSNEFYEFNENYIGSKTDKGYYGKGFYFTEGSPDSHYGEREIPCFLNIQNPFSYKSTSKQYELDTNEIKQKGYDGVLVFPKFVTYNKNKHENIDVENIDLTLGLGYYGNRIEEIVAYYPEQIKLADGTNTTFDSNNPDIRYGLGGSVVSGRNRRIMKQKRQRIDFDNTEVVIKPIGYGNEEEFKDLWSDNIIPKNPFFAWLYNDVNANEKVSSGQYDLAKFKNALGLFWDIDVKEYKGGENIIALLEGRISDDRKKIYILSMTTNPIYRKSGGMSYLIRKVREKFNLERDSVHFVGLTSDGKKFYSNKKFEKGGNILNSENKYELGGELTLTTEQVENKLGRKLHWWNDDVVNINGIEYKKVFLKPEYKRL